LNAFESFPPGVDGNENFDPIALSLFIVEMNGRIE
jgi:hypothetical protein